MTPPLDDLDVELLLSGGTALTDRPDLQPLGDVLTSLDAALRPAQVTPSPALAAMLDDGTVTASPGRRRLLRLVGSGGSVGLALKLAVGGAAAAATLVVAGAAGVLPEPVQDVVDRITDRPGPTTPDPQQAPAPGLPPIQPDQDGTVLAPQDHPDRPDGPRADHVELARSHRAPDDPGAGAAPATSPTAPAGGGAAVTPEPTDQDGDGGNDDAGGESSAGSGTHVDQGDQDAAAEDQESDDGPAEDDPQEPVEQPDDDGAVQDATSSDDE